MHGQVSREELLHSRRFTLVGRLGEGGMGTVYEVVDQERHARVALKALRRPGPEELLRFKSEFRKLQDLHHPNLISLGELVEEQGQLFFTMELVRGQDFLSWVRSGATGSPGEGATTWPDLPTQALRPGAPTEDEATLRLEHTAPPSTQPTPPAKAASSALLFDEQRLRQALGQLALGVHALHRACKVHRDIKPSNILITPQGRLVLLDFGILSEMEGDQDWNGSLVVGTASYMAPEQAEGAPPSPAADWYSVGVLLYQALTGHRPFVGSPQEVLELKRRVEPVPPYLLVQGLPEDLSTLCLELLRRDPAQRPSSEQVLRRLGVEHIAREEVWSTPSLPFVGRQQELRALRSALTDSRRGASVVVRVEGESGVGKSRLVRHFLEQVAESRPEAVVLAGRCYQRESVPYKGVDGIIDALARHLRGRGREEARELMPPGAAPLARLFPVLRGLADGEAEPPEPADPYQLRLSAFAALRELLLRLAERHPLVLWVDDLQWADRDSTALLEELLRAPGLLLVCTARLSAEQAAAPEVSQCRIWREARVLRLQGLRPEEARSLVGRLPREDRPLTEAEAQRIAEESGGHPLFLHALMNGPRASSAPVRLEEALWARVARLEPEARELLELVAVADGPLRHEVTIHVSQLELVEYGRHTSSLRGAHLALTSGPPPGGTLEVLHDRIRQAVVPHLPPERRRQLHARLATALEQLGHGHPEALALHWREAGAPQGAARYLLRAARQAAHALAFARAAALYRQALELGEWEPAERRAHQEALATALGHAGRGADSAQAFLAAAQGAPPAEARSLRRRAAEQYLLSGHVEAGLATMRQVLTELGLHLPEVGRPRSRLQTWLREHLPPRRPRLRPRVPEHSRERLEIFQSLTSGLRQTLPQLGEHAQARFLRLALRAGEPHSLCQALCFELLAYSREGARATRYQRWLERQLESLLPLCEGEPLLLALERLSRASRATLRLDFATSRLHFEHALQQLQGCVGAHWTRTLAWSLGTSALAMGGELEQLRRRAEPLLAEAWERGNRAALSAIVLGSGTLRWLGAGQPERGRQEADEVLALWPRESYPLQRFGHTLSHVYVDLYEGQATQALRRLEELRGEMRRWGGLRSPSLRARLLDLTCRARLMEAGRRSAGPLLPPPREELRALEQVVVAEGLEAARGLAVLVGAGLAAAEGRPEAAERYAEAAGLLERAGLLLHAMGARLRQGELLGGEQGHQLMETTQAWLRQRGARHPERMAHMFAPAMGPHQA